MLSGPSHAEEAARAMPTGVVAASNRAETAELVQRVFTNERFRVYTHDDMVGVELAGALKNVAALCCGVSDGLGLGDNTKALLITRAMAETSRLAERLGGRKETLAGLAGMGDLIVTCTSMHSRNRRAGIAIGEVNYDGTLSGDLSDGTAVLTLKNLPASVLTGSDSNKALAVTCSIKMDTILLGDITTSAKMSIWVER